MFGTIIIDPKAMEADDRARYQTHYCGLCRRLGAHYGGAGSATLTYDMTFLSLLLASLYRLPEQTGAGRCVPHPLRPRAYTGTEATDYAAHINLFLAYYQYLDDWHDDGNRLARARSARLEPWLPAIRSAYPRQCEAVEHGLKRLNAIEKAGELNPDLPANCFGALMGELFVWREDAYADTLRRMGAALGRFVYLLDAVNDLRSDIKKERYNPLVAQPDTDFAPMLTLMMAECTAAFDTLPIEQDRRILQNVLYAGVWQSYVRKPERTDTRHG